MELSSEKAVRKAWSALAASGVKQHRHSIRCMNILRHVLFIGEKTLFEARQCYLKSLAPNRIVATEKRLIIVDPSFWGLWTGHDIFDSTHYLIMPYKHIVSVTVSTGLLFATITIHTTAGTGSGPIFQKENEIHGIFSTNAMIMATFLGEIIEFEEELKEEQQQKAEAEAQNHNHVYSFYREDLKTGMDYETARSIVLSNKARFVWFGVEPVEDVANLLGVNKSKVLQISANQLLSYSRKQIEQLRSLILISYDGIMAMHTSRMLNKKNGVETKILQGGIMAVARKLKDTTTEFL